MRRILTICSFLCLAFSQLHANELEALFNKANETYAAKEYVEAADLYQQVVDKGMVSFDLYYNLGNAYYRSGDVGPSVLYYEKALKMDPSNEDAVFNLKVANLKVADRVEPLQDAFFFRLVNELLLKRSPDGWAHWSLALLWAALVFAIGYLFVNKLAFKRLLFAFSFLLLLGSAGLALISLRQIGLEQSTKEGIIMATNSYVKSAPDNNSTDLFILREGVKVRLLVKEGLWQQIKIVDREGDKIGWIDADHVEAI